MTRASLVDCLVESKRSIVLLPEPMAEYNSMFVPADELSAFMDQWDKALVAGLLEFYDVNPYSEARRIFKDVPIKLARPQVSILAGVTPSNLIGRNAIIPESAWDGGFVSRLIMVYSNERGLLDMFNTPNKESPTDMIYDLNIIHGLYGQFDRTDEYARALHNWRSTNELPGPTHPKLVSYNSRRDTHLIKLSMIASIDCSNDLVLKVGDFNRAMGWLLEAEQAMPMIFDAISVSPDAQAMDEVAHFIAEFGAKGVSEHRVVDMIRRRITYGSQAKNILEVMESAGQIRAIALDRRTGLKIYVAGSHPL